MSKPDLQSVQEQNRLIDSMLNLHETLLMTTEEALKKGRFKSLSRKEMLTLQRIGPYGEKTMGETAQLLNVTLGTLTVAINRLVKKGYVSRRRDEADHRKVLLSLTRDGQVACRLFRRFNRRMTQRVLLGLNQAAVVDLTEFVEETERRVSELYQEYLERAESR